MCFYVEGRSGSVSRRFGVHGCDSPSLTLSPSPSSSLDVSLSDSHVLFTPRLVCKESDN